MSERWVLNASPLIVLAHISQAHLFRELTGDVIVPRSVATEIALAQRMMRQPVFYVKGIYPL